MEITRFIADESTWTIRGIVHLPSGFVVETSYGEFEVVGSKLSLGNPSTMYVFLGSVRASNNITHINLEEAANYLAQNVATIN